MFSDPNKNIDQFGLKAGMLVADLGSGSGFYTLASAKAVGPEGKVFAIDIQKVLLSKVKDEANKAGLFNVEIIWGDIEKLGGTRLRDGSLDFVILSNILFQVSDKETVIKETSRILKKDGFSAVIDWADSFGGLGPRPENVFPLELAKETFQRNGFVIEKELKVGEHHYGFIVRKS